MPNNSKKPLIKTNELSTDTKASMKKRIIIGALVAMVVVPCVFVGWWFYLALIVFVIGVATYEIASLPSRRLSFLLWATVFVTMYALIFWVVIKHGLINEFKDFDINMAFGTIWLSPIALAVMIMMYFLVIVFKPKFTVMDACYLIAVTLLLALGFQAVLYIRYIPFNLFAEPDVSIAVDVSSNYFKYCQSALLLFYLLIAICFNDMGAYFVGVLFGKHKINPRISPKKTWEGFAGGIIVSLILSMAMALVCAACHSPLLPFFTLDRWYWIFLCSVVLPLVGDLGDFAFSAIKRQFNKKDYSHILGPHGGVLDRIDSALFGALALTILVAFISNNWSFLEWGVI
ncbi:MAG: phosphatidate cytidylyltransferase [Bacilli bacterium]|nr:phosphatidate cytidylyltransferase [Bacilli bacterium]